MMPYIIHLWKYSNCIRIILEFILSMVWCSLFSSTSFCRIQLNFLVFAIFFDVKCEIPVRITNQFSKLISEKKMCTDRKFHLILSQTNLNPLPKSWLLNLIQLYLWFLDGNVLNTLKSKCCQPRKWRQNVISHRFVYRLIKIENSVEVAHTRAHTRTHLESQRLMINNVHILFQRELRTYAVTVMVSIFSKICFNIVYKQLFLR